MILYAATCESSAWITFSKSQLSKSVGKQIQYVDFDKDSAQFSAYHSDSTAVQ